MPVNKEAYQQLLSVLRPRKVTLVAVSKTQPVEAIKELYDLGHRDFGENYVQELVSKAAVLPKDIRWHFIGHLQTNKVGLIAPFVQLIHGVDSLKLLKEVNKQGGKLGRVIDCLLQVDIAREVTKFGLDEKEVDDLLMRFGLEKMTHAMICGLMGMASFTSDWEKVRSEFRSLKKLFDKLNTHHLPLTTLSMGMSSDYTIALEEGATMVRIGSLLFGERSQL